MTAPPSPPTRRGALHPAIPFDPARWPVFYGWPMVAMCVGGIVASMPGQTNGVSAFVEPLLRISELDRTWLSTAYLVGTLASASALPAAGSWVDRFGARRVMMGASLLMGIILWAMSGVDVAARQWAAWTRIAPAVVFAVLLAAGFALMRFAGQGLMVICCQTTIGHWFDRRRGLATAVNSTVLALTTTNAPLVLTVAVIHLGWDGAWLMLAAVVGLGWLVVTWVLWRDDPESCGLHPDGLSPDTPRPAHLRTGPVPGWTRAEAMHTRAFWTAAGSAALMGLIATAVAFHLQDLGHRAGLHTTQANAFLSVMGATTVPVSLSAGFFADRVRPRWLCLGLAASLVLHLILMPFYAPGWRYLAPAMALGCAAGLMGPVLITIHPRYFGRQHLGAINGAQWSLVAIASAVGPLLYALALRLTGSYAGAMAILLVPAILLVLSALTLRPPRRQPQPAANEET